MKNHLLLLGASLLVLLAAPLAPAQQNTVQQPGPPPPSASDAEKKAYYSALQQQWLAANPNRSAVEPPDITHEKVETRACSKSDIIGGMWKMIYFREDPPLRDDRYNRRIKHQYLSFDPTNFYTRVNSAYSIDDPNRARSLMRPSADENFAQKYIINEKDDNTTELIFLSGKKALSRESCTIVTKPLDAYKPGDLILKSYTKAHSLLFRLYRRWF